MNGLSKVWFDLPKPAKVFVVIGGGLVAWFGVLNPVRKVIVSKLNAAKMAREGKEAGDELDKLKKKGIRPTISPAQAEAMCNSMVSSFAGCGTDEGAVFRVMSQMKNNADVYLLISTWGIRKYDDCGPWTGNVEFSLSAAISDELDDTEKFILNGLLKKNGVTFQFS
jgi:hypothetical protein